MFGKAIVTAYANLKLERWTETKLQDGFQGRIQTGSKGSHKPVKHFRFLKQSIEINYQIHDYKNFRLSQVKLRKFLKKLKGSMLQVSLFPLHLSYIFAARAVPCDLYFLPPGWRTRLNSPDEPFCFCEFDFLEPFVD